MGSAPRMDLPPQEAIVVLTTLTHMLGEEARDHIRGVLLSQASDPDARKLLTWLNDFERVREWGRKHGHIREASPSGSEASS